MNLIDQRKGNTRVESEVRKFKKKQNRWRGLYNKYTCDHKKRNICTFTVMS